MMNIDFKPDAVRFVREHHIAGSCDVATIESAMRLEAYIGAAHVIRGETKRLQRLRAGLDLNDGGERSGQILSNNGH